MKNPEIKPGKALICGSMAFDTISMVDRGERYRQRSGHHVRLPDGH